MDPIKIAGVTDWPTPKDGKDVLSFLGFTNFYRRFIHDYAHIAEPLNLLKRKGVVWRWDKPQQEAFKTLKSRITSEPVLIQPDSSKPFCLECDSSGHAAGSVLLQEGSDGKWHPVAFNSKLLTAVERNYPIHDCELLSVIRSFKEWKHLLEGASHKIEVWNDHMNLQYFMKSQDLNW